jgi:hypothetical protein
MNWIVPVFAIAVGIGAIFIVVRAEGYKSFMEILDRLIEGRCIECGMKPHRWNCPHHEEVK